MHTKKPALLSFVFILISANVFAVGTDSLRVKKKMQWYQTNAFKFGATPVLLIGLGISEINNHGIYSSFRVENKLQDEFPRVNTRIDDILPSMPAVLACGLYIAGIKGRNTPVNAAIMFFTANALGGFIGQQLKESTHIQRPDGSDFMAFPSNHTIAAFMAAEFLHQEYKDQSAWISIAGYTMATTVGSIRMLENHHWLSDVLAGAGIGILSTRITYVVYPWIHNAIFKKHPVKGFSFAPVYSDGKAGASISYRF